MHHRKIMGKPKNVNKAKNVQFHENMGKFINFAEIGGNF